MYRIPVRFDVTKSDHIFWKLISTSFRGVISYCGPRAADDDKTRIGEEEYSEERDLRRKKLHKIYNAFQSKLKWIVLVVRINAEYHVDYSHGYHYSISQSSSNVAAWS
ncbi:MAG: hypothetical protein DLM72_09095 [Candidatus Nitrosopolaris wilkensis]|nr:MAG: hypothetical protein DLM72_09095 [Candidatus Nitrosopolaris wilkensis]